MRERWKELDGQATPGPWCNLATTPNIEGRVTVMVGHEVDGGTLGLAEMYDDGARSQHDAAFIMWARTGWPAAERECEQLRSENEKLRDAIREARVDEREQVYAEWEAESAEFMANLAAGNVRLARGDEEQTP